MFTSNADNAGPVLVAGKRFRQRPSSRAVRGRPASDAPGADSRQDMCVARKHRGRHFAAPSDGDWAKVGTNIVHSTFGTGTVVSVGLSRGAPAVWIDFDRGDRMVLDPETASEHTRIRTAKDRTTSPDARLCCDVCGQRPVVVKIGGAEGTQQFCENHRGSYRPER